jgi:uncharacterized sulfatase
VPEILQGESLLPIFEKPDSCEREQAFLEFNRFELDHDGFGAFSPSRCVVTDRYKLVVNLTDKDELYDLQSDPGEIRNLIDDISLAEVGNGLHDKIIEWMNRTRDPFRGPQWKNRAWRDMGAKSWGGPTRPHPLDGYNPRSLLYDTAEEIDRLVYEKH